MVPTEEKTGLGLVYAKRQIALPRAPLPTALSLQCIRGPALLATLSFRDVAVDAPGELQVLLPQSGPVAGGFDGALCCRIHPILLVHALTREVRFAYRVERAVAVWTPPGAAEDRRGPAGAVDSQDGAAAIALATLCTTTRGACGERGGFVGSRGVLELPNEVSRLETLGGDLFKGFVLVVIIDDPPPA